MSDDWQMGYSKGYQAGYSEGVAKTDGYSAGYNRGYVKAVDDRASEVEKLTAEVAYQKARAAYFKYVPEIENDPEGVQALVVEMREAREAFFALSKETPSSDKLMEIMSEIVQERSATTIRDMVGIWPDMTGGLSVDEYMDEQRGRGTE